MPYDSYPKLELKYCERCGGLCVRPHRADTVYCASCAEAIAELPPPRRGGTPPGTMQAARATAIAFVAAVMTLADCGMGVCA